MAEILAIHRLALDPFQLCGYRIATRIVSSFLIGLRPQPRWGSRPDLEVLKGAEIPLLARPLSPSSSIEIMPSDGAYPVKPGQSDSTESMLVPLVNQFGLMQQQMFDQFQQAMSMLVQMFGKMHRDQMDVIRAELDRLHELTEEFQSLKDELAKRAQAQSRAGFG